MFLAVECRCLCPEVKSGHLIKSKPLRFRFNAYEGRSTHELESSKPVQRRKNSQPKPRNVEKSELDLWPIQPYVSSLTANIQYNGPAVTDCCGLFHAVVRLQAKRHAPRVGVDPATGRLRRGEVALCFWRNP
jgi:hypothetical protein